MNTLKGLALAALSLLLLAPAALAQQGVVTSDDILKQLDKKPEAAPSTSRSFARGIRINKTGEAKATEAKDTGAKAESAEPTREAAAPAQPAEKPSVTVYLYFKSGSAELTGDHSKKQLAAVGQALSSPALAGAHFEIGGHTDSQGTDAQNQTLSEQRASHIRDLLVKTYGVKPDSVIAKGYGESQPVADNTTDAGRAKNRRVVIKRLD